jgi:hypothetical protein
LTRPVRDGERGATLIVVMVLLVALLAGAGVALSVQLGDTRSVGLIRETRDSTYCAEAGLAASRATISASYASWALLLDGDAANDPPWYPIVGDIGDGGDPDYEVTVRDNDDERAPNANDPTRDDDLLLFIVARCTRYPDTPREILELVGYEGAGSVYRDQQGQGASNTGNTN